MGLIGSDGRAMILGIGLGGYVAMLFAVAHPEDVAALLLIDVAVAHPGRGAASASADTPPPPAPTVGAFSFLSGGSAVARAESYIRWGFGGPSGPRLAPSRLAAALSDAYPGVADRVLAECYLRPVS